MRLPLISFRPAISALVALTSLFTIANYMGIPASAQTLTFSTPERDTTTQIGGETNETGVGAAVFNNLMYVAYISVTKYDSKGNAFLYVASNSDGGIYYNNKTAVVNSNNGANIIAASNPALAVWNNALYLGYIDGSGIASFVSSTDGEHWGTPTSCNLPGGDVADSSPSMAVFNGDLYMGYRNHLNHYMDICQISTSHAPIVYEADNLPSLNFNPSLAVYNNKLYAAFEGENSSHTLYFATTATTFGSGFTLQTGASGDQSGTAPSLAVHNGVLYLGFRSNDGSQVFLYKYSTDGVTFSKSTGGKWGEGGPPTLVNATGLTGSSYNGQLYVFFSSQTSAPNYLCSSHGS